MMKWKQNRRVYLDEGIYTFYTETKTCNYASAAACVVCIHLTSSMGL
jgi:hypothetical protein